MIFFLSNSTIRRIEKILWSFPTKQTWHKKLNIKNHFFCFERMIRMLYFRSQTLVIKSRNATFRYFPFNQNLNSERFKTHNSTFKMEKRILEKSKVVTQKNCFSNEFQMIFLNKFHTTLKLNTSLVPVYSLNDFYNCSKLC